MINLIQAAFIGICLWLCLTINGAGAQENRVALVIGNSDYQTVSRLPNPVNDAAAAANLFQSAGFKVFLRQNLANVELRRAIRDFQIAARNADMAVIFFAGHGLEIRGTNYLLPVDAKLVSDLDAVDEAIPLDRMLEAVEKVKKFRMVILDACRENPFEKRMTRNFSTRTVGRGLAEIGAPSNMLISYAAKAGSTADDGADEHSPFTTAMLKYLTTPGLEIRIALGKIRDEVMQQTGNRQEPFTYGSLGGEEIYLTPAGLPGSASTRLPSNLDVQAAYQFALQIATTPAWQAFLAQHPTGFHAELARAQLAKLNVPAPGPAATSRTSSDENSEWDRIKITDDPAALRAFIERFPNSPKVLDAQSRLQILERTARGREERARDQTRQRSSTKAAARAKQEELREKRQAQQEKQRKQREVKPQIDRTQPNNTTPSKQRSMNVPGSKRDPEPSVSNPSKLTGRHLAKGQPDRKRATVVREAPSRSSRAAFQEQPGPTGGPSGGVAGLLGIFGIFGPR